LKDYFRCDENVQEYFVNHSVIFVSRYILL